MFKLKILGIPIADQYIYIQTSGYLSCGVEVNEGLAIIGVMSLVM